MFKKMRNLMLMIMALGFFGLTACTNEQLNTYKTTGKETIEAYANERKDNHSEDNCTVICGVVAKGKEAIEEADSKSTIDYLVSSVKDEIEAVQTKYHFPSILDDFNKEEFTEEFFESNTLILVPFEWSYLLYEYLDFYTVFVENGKLNFLIEVSDPYGMGDAAIDMRLFAVIISNAVFENLAMGEIIVFETYDFSNVPPIENSKELLIEAENNTVDYRASLVPNEAFNQLILNVVVVKSMEKFQEYFSV